MRKKFVMPFLKDANTRPRKLTLEQLDDITRMNHDKIIKLREKLRKTEEKLRGAINALRQKVKKLEK